ESEIRQDWELPYRVNLDDSQSFCRDCGAILGWMLNQDLPEGVIASKWVGLLSNQNAQLQLLEK
ncbi:MAG: hypothetical protein ACE5FD_16020, partial [Anaerolineae bacterium]